MIFYNGPLRTSRNTSVMTSDYMLLELHGGYPLLRVNHGSGEARLEIDARDATRNTRQQQLNDGRCHRIDVFRRGRQVRLVVDECRAAQIDESEMKQKSSQQRQWCETATSTPGSSRYLNVHTPLQLGGRSDAGHDFPIGVQKHGLHGCIKNFRHNGQVRDACVRNKCLSDLLLVSCCDKVCWNAI